MSFNATRCVAWGSAGRVNGCEAKQGRPDHPWSAAVERGVGRGYAAPSCCGVHDESCPYLGSPCGERVRLTANRQTWVGSALRADLVGFGRVERPAQPRLTGPVSPTHYPKERRLGRHAVATLPRVKTLRSRTARPGRGSLSPGAGLWRAWDRRGRRRRSRRRA